MAANTAEVVVLAIGRSLCRLSLACSSPRYLSNSCRAWIESEGQAPGNNIAVRAHGYMLDGGVHIANRTSQGAGSKDGNGARVGREHLANRHRNSGLRERNAT